MDINHLTIKISVDYEYVNTLLILQFKYVYRV